MRTTRALVLLLAIGASLTACSSGETQPVSAAVAPTPGAAQTTNAAAEPASAITAPAAEDVVINGSNTKQTQAVRGQNIEVAGDENTAMFTGHCGELSVMGSGNVVVLENVKTINVTGDNNTITWRGSAPTLTNLGQHNVIERAK